MRILLVEDDDDQVDIFVTALAARSADTEVIVARSRDSAIEALATTFFDFVVCDLKIPTIDGGLDTALEYGIDVQRFIFDEVRGTPCFFFSAFGADLVLDQHVIPFAGPGDPFMTGTERPMLDMRSKRQINRCVDDLGEFAQAIDYLERVTLTADVELDQVEQRLVRLAARKQQADAVAVELLQGGLSSARTFKVTGTDADGSLRLRAAVKIDRLSNLDSDESGFARLASVLGSEIVATQAFVVREGANGRGAIVYSLAIDHSTLFRVAAEDEPRALASLRSLRGEVDTRLGQGPPVNMTVAEIRRIFVSDEQAQDIYPKDLGLDFSAVEEKQVKINRCVLHSDLHGSNVLIAEDGHPLLIDFASVAEGPASIDPVLLEMSLVFHPYGRQVLPSGDELLERDWTDTDGYCAILPAPDIGAFCREWAHETAGSEGEILAVAYGWALRQLMYPESNHPLARRIILATASRLLAMTNDVSDG